jgi:hypothetical protein
MRMVRICTSRLDLSKAEESDERAYYCGIDKC